MGMGEQQEEMVGEDSFDLQIIEHFMITFFLKMYNVTLSD